MKNLEIKYCPGSLSEGYSTYSSAIIRRVFDGHKVSHILPFGSPDSNDQLLEKFQSNMKRISISGVQEKFSLVLDKNKLRLTVPEESGQYILKPIPRDVVKVDQVPANEHLTMQIAKQVYDIDTAENCLIFFEDHKPAYLVKRFDINPKGKKFTQEDMAAVANQSKENAGPDFKYEYDYLRLGSLISNSVSAVEVEMEKYYKLILFNYLFSNGDAHLKNFSLLESENGDYLLSPAYDLLCTRLHVKDSDMALSGGLGEKSIDHPSFSALGYYAYDDFYDFGTQLGIKEERVKKTLDLFKAEHTKITELVEHSFLNTQTKVDYINEYKNKLLRINTSLSKRI